MNDDSKEISKLPLFLFNIVSHLNVIKLLESCDKVSYSSIQTHFLPFFFNRGL